MNTINYLKEIYGYSTPIFLKDIRIGGKSKTSIRKELSRAAEKGDIKRDANGVYYFDLKGEYPDKLSVNEVITKRFIKNDYGIPGFDIEIYGYTTGQTFLNSLGISQQVPAVYEIVTNNTSCKRMFVYKGRRVLLRKGKVTIDRTNYKILQFLDAFYYLDINEVREYHDNLYQYIQSHLTKEQLQSYLALYPYKIHKLLIEGELV